jgi:hypothetical protein
MSFTKLCRVSRGELVYLVNGKDAGEDAWHYILVDKLKLPLFLAKIKQGALDIAEYGLVLHSGWGLEPPQHIKDTIESEYK